MNKTGTRGSSRSKANFAHAFTELATFAEAVAHKEWHEAMINENNLVPANGTWNLVDFSHDVIPSVVNGFIE